MEPLVIQRDLRACVGRVLSGGGPSSSYLPGSPVVIVHEQQTHVQGMRARSSFTSRHFPRLGRDGRSLNYSFSTARQPSLTRRFSQVPCVPLPIPTFALDSQARLAVAASGSC